MCVYSCMRGRVRECMYVCECMYLHTRTHTHMHDEKALKERSAEMLEGESWTEFSAGFSEIHVYMYAYIHTHIHADVLVYCNRFQ